MAIIYLLEWGDKNKAIRLVDGIFHSGSLMGSLMGSLKVEDDNELACVILTLFNIFVSACIYDINYQKKRIVL